MIDQFKKSRFGQIVLTFFIAATITSGVVVWLYEAIRIPTLNGQISFRDDKIKNLESDEQRITDAKKDATQELEFAKLQLANLKSNLAQSTNEFKALAEKLNQIQDENAKLSGHTINIPQTNYPYSESNHPAPSDRFKRIADQSQISLLQIDSTLTELRLKSYAMFNLELQQIQSSTLAQLNVSAQIPVTQMTDHLVATFTNATQLIHEYYGFRISVEALRSYSYKKIFNHYQTLLAQASQGEDAPLLDLPKPEIVQTIMDMTSDLETNQVVRNWNSQNAKVIDDFLAKATPRKPNP
jgi:hypothetical protein